MKKTAGWLIHALLIGLLSVVLSPVAAADEAALQSLDPIKGLYYTGTLSNKRLTMLLRFKVIETSGKEGRGWMTWYAQYNNDKTCEHEKLPVTLRLIESGGLEIGFYRPICDDEAGVPKPRTYLFTFAEGGKVLNTHKGGKLTLKEE